MKKLLTTITLSIVLIFILVLPALALIPTTTLPAQANIPIDKVWEVNFNQPVDASTIRDIKMFDSTGATLNIEPIVDPFDSKVVLIKHSTPFVNGKNYHLWVYAGVKSLTTGKGLLNFTELPFSTFPEAQTIAEVQQAILGTWNFLDGKYAIEFYTDGTFERTYLGNGFKILFEGTYAFSSPTRIRMIITKYWDSSSGEWNDISLISTNDIILNGDQLEIKDWSNMGNCIFEKVN